MSIFYYNQTDTESERRTRVVWHSDQRTKIHTHYRTATNRSFGKTHERNPNSEMRSARQKAAI